MVMFFPLMCQSHLYMVSNWLEISARGEFILGIFTLVSKSSDK